jgi:hypothetical protein
LIASAAGTKDGSATSRKLPVFDLPGYHVRAALCFDINNG